MKAIIIEDEELAAQRLKALINECDPGIEVIAMLESICDSVEWFRQNPQPDLIFLDIHLEDGLSCHFRRSKNQCSCYFYNRIRRICH